MFTITLKPNLLQKSLHVLMIQTFDTTLKNVHRLNGQTMIMGQTIFSMFMEVIKLKMDLVCYGQLGY